MFKNGMRKCYENEVILILPDVVQSQSTLIAKVSAGISAVNLPRGSLEPEPSVQSFICR